eukprot:6211127-Pleurochrysis_carterae.AAC.1
MGYGMMRCGKREMGRRGSMNVTMSLFAYHIILCLSPPCAMAPPGGARPPSVREWAGLRVCRVPEPAPPPVPEGFLCGVCALGEAKNFRPPGPLGRSDRRARCKPPVPERGA